MIYTITFCYYDIEGWRPSHGNPGKESTLSFDVVVKSEEEAQNIAHKIFVMAFGQFKFIYKDPKDFGIDYSTLKLPWEVKEKKDES